MIYQEVVVGVARGKMNEYLDIVGKELLPIYQRLGIKMAGSFRTMMGGNSNEVIVLFAFENMAQMEKLQDDRNKDKEWQKVYPKYQAVTTGTMASRILQPNSYSELK